jgi:hypothetical protein
LAGSDGAPEGQRQLFVFNSHSGTRGAFVQHPTFRVQARRPCPDYRGSLRSNLLTSKRRRLRLTHRSACTGAAGSRCTIGGSAAAQSTRGRRCAALGLLLRRRQILDQPQVEMRRRPCVRLNEGHPGQIRDLAVLSHPAAQLIERIRWAGVNLPATRSSCCGGSLRSFGVVPAFSTPSGAPDWARPRAKVAILRLQRHLIDSEHGRARRQLHQCIRPPPSKRVPTRGAQAGRIRGPNKTKQCAPADTPSSCGQYG